jgi:hypothetical protein
MQAVLIAILSAPALSNLAASIRNRIPPQTVMGLKTFLAVA